MPDEHAPPGPGGGQFVSAGNSPPPSPNLLLSLPGNESAAAARLQDRAQDSAARAAAHAAAHPAHAPKTPKAHAPKAPKAPKSTAAPTFAELQQWEKDAQAGKHLTARQAAALHAAHEAHLAHEAHVTAAAKSAWDGTPDDDDPDEAAQVIAKADGGPQRYCLGIAYQAGPAASIARGQDGGRDFLDAADLEKSAWEFLANGPRVGMFHLDGTETTGDGEATATVVESYIYRPEQPWDLGNGIVVNKGDWLLGAILSPRAWDMYQRGLITGWSPQGLARRHRAG